MFKKVKNSNRYRSAAKHYWFIRDGEHTPYLFSDSQMESARQRATDNPEDVPYRGGVGHSIGFVVFSFASGVVITTTIALAYFMTR
jgi:hypothetical protein